MIRARKLSKRFGEKRVIEKLDLEVPRGGFVLVTGPNGSGKTTLLRLCAGLYAPTDGELEVEVPRGSIGFLGHEALVYRELTALENLDLFDGLDAEGVELLHTELAERSGATALVATHDPEALAARATARLALA